MSGLVKRISSLFRFGRARYLVGSDLSENKYYEYPSLDGDADPRRTRRLVRFRVHKELGEYDQSTLPTQWLMWLRHTRRSAPTIEELVADRERIAMTQHNAWVLQQRDEQRRLELEQKADAYVRERQLIEQEDYSPNLKGHVPTSTVTDKEARKEAEWRVPNEAQQVRTIDMEVWEASRKRVQAQNEQQQRHAAQEQDEENVSEKERARQLMSQSPLSAFDVSYVDEHPSQQRQHQSAPPKASGLNPRFGRQSGPSENWTPEEWRPSQPARRRQ